MNSKSSSFGSLLLSIYKNKTYLKKPKILVPLEISLPYYNIVYYSNKVIQKKTFQSKSS